MAPPEPPNEITIRVKVPPGHIAGSSADEFSLGTVSTSSHVGDLRLKIQQLLPSNPSPERQRLLYAGRALFENDQTLATALNTRRDTSQVEYVIHLLVKGEQDANGGHGASNRRTTGTPGSGNGLVNSGLPQEQGTSQFGGQPRDSMSPGLPPPPQGTGQMPHDLPHAQHMALLMQRQQQMRLARMNQEQQQRAAGLAVPPWHAGRPAPGAVPAHAPNPAPFTSGQLSQHYDNTRTEQQFGENQNNGDQSSEQNSTQQANTRYPGGQDFSDSQHQTPQQNQGPQRPVSGQGFHVQGVGPDGNRFEIHQQTVNIPFPGQQPRFNMPTLPGVGLPFPMPGMAQQQRTQNQPSQPNGPSALDRARQNVAEMRQMVDDMCNDNDTEEDRARTARLQEHIQAVNNYIDPFGVSRPNPTSRSASPFPARMAQSMQASPALGLGGLMAPPRAPSVSRPLGIPQNTRQQASDSNVTCYLLSSPEGPRALLFSPEHGNYTGSLPSGISASIGPGVHHRHGAQPIMPDALNQPTPTPAQPANNGQGQPDQAGNAPAVDPAVAAAHQIVEQLNQAQQAQARPAAEPNPLGPLQPFLAHFWLLLRVMIFAYFVLGTNMGWRRPVALALIGLGFWMIRAGLFGEGGVARRWWDGIIHVEQRPRQQPQTNAEGQDGEPRAGHLPTPEELAQRLMQEREEALQRAPLHRVREHLRPVERAAALFFASLWPGVGEAHVRAREAEERRQAEEEVEHRRREEEERQRAAEAEQGGEKKEGESPTDAAPATGSGEKAATENPGAESSKEDEKQVIGEKAGLPLSAEQTEQ